MKKIYNKPQIVFESFELTASIAAGCMQIVEKEENGDYTDNGYIIFGESCEDIQLNEENFCYHVPYEAMALLTS